MPDGNVITVEEFNRRREAGEIVFSEKRGVYVDRSLAEEDEREEIMNDVAEHKNRQERRLVLYTGCAHIDIREYLEGKGGFDESKEQLNRALRQLADAQEDQSTKLRRALSLIAFGYDTAETILEKAHVHGADEIEELKKAHEALQAEAKKALGVESD
jgi:uncharacterized protein with ATP-grasp and redox domains